MNCNAESHYLVLTCDLPVKLVFLARLASDFNLQSSIDKFQDASHRARRPLMRINIHGWSEACARSSGNEARWLARRA